MAGETTTQLPAHPGLDQHQLDAWERDGFVIVGGLYPPALMQQWKRVLQDVLDAERQAAEKDQWDISGSGVRVWMADRLHPTLLEAMRDQRVTPILKQIVGPNVEFLSAKAVFKNKATAFASPWHQDWFYWEGATKISVWIALDDATPANGALKFIPGSHRKVFQKQVAENTNAFVNRIDEQDLAGLDVITAKVKQGDAAFFHDLAVHSSHPNTAGTDRWSVISTYRDAATPDNATVWEKPMLVTGRSVNGGTANPRG